MPVEWPYMAHIFLNEMFFPYYPPPEKDVQWSEQGMISSYKFIQKLWTLHNEIKIKIINEDRQIINEDLEKFTNRLVAKFTNNLEKFNYNVIIANMYETYNFLTNFINEPLNPYVWAIE